MKGQSRFVSYMLTVLFSILVLTSISALVYTVYRAALEREIRAELAQIATQTKDNLIKIYDSGKNSRIQPTNYTSALISEIDLNLPDSVAKLNYEVDLISASSLYSYLTAATIGGVNISGIKDASAAKVIAKTTQDPIVALEFDLPNLDINIQGKIRNGLNDVLRYYRHNQNSTIYDTVILGQSDIIIRVTDIR